MSTGSLYARILCGADDRNTAYPWKRRQTPFGSETSTDQPDDAVLDCTVGTNSTNSAEATGPSRRRQR